MNERGVDAVFSRFVAGYDAGKLAHAYLLVGDPRGNAEKLAEKILCLLFCLSETGRPCFSCRACRQALARTVPDIVWCEPIKKSRTIQVDQIRAICNHIGRTSFAGGWKAVVIACADRMNVESANMLLKVLEEPPDKNMFLLLSAMPEAILPTVLSRCQKVVLTDPTPVSDCDATVSEIMLKKSGSELSGNGFIGKMSSALMFCDVLARWRSEITDKIKSDDSNEEPKEESVVVARVEAEYRERRSALLRALELWHRDVLLCVAGAGHEAFHFREHADVISKTASGLTFRQAMNNIKAVEEINLQLNMYFSEQSAFERGFCEMSG